MKRYCINDFLDSKYGLITYSRQSLFKNKYVQIEDLTNSSVMKKGDNFGKILIFDAEISNNVEREISLIVPQNGYYFIDTFYVLNRIKNINITECIFRCYEEIEEGETIVNDEDFADIYNELFETLYYYNEGFLNEIDILRKCAYLGKSDFSIGFPKTEVPIDFWSLVNRIFAPRRIQNSKKIATDLKTLTQMVDDACHMSHTLLFITRKKIVIEEHVINFEDISEISYDGTIKDKCGNIIGYTTNASTRIIISNIIQANIAGDYSHICQINIGNDCSCYYAIDELIDIDKLAWSASDELQLALINPYDLFIENKVSMNHESCHYYIEGEPMFEIGDSYNKVKGYCKKSGYYSFDIPSFFSPLFLDIPFIYYTPSNLHHEKNRTIYDKINVFHYSIIQDRFTKAKTLKWKDRDYIQLLPDEWYSFFVSFNYKNDEPTLILGFCDLYSKNKIVQKEYIDGKSYVFYLLLENGQSLRFGKQKYKESYLNESTFDIWVEYGVEVSEIVAFTKNAIKEIRIETPEENRIEYCAEPSFYGDFKKYAKLYYDAIVKCDPTIRVDYSTSSAISETCFVYLMHDASNGYYKIGISNNPEYRERTLQSEKPTIELIKAKEFPVRAIAEAFEAALHKTYAAKRLRGEWFSLEPKDVKDIVISLT